MGRGIWRVSPELVAEALGLPDPDKTKLIRLEYDKDWDCLCVVVEHYDIPDRKPLPFCRPSGAPFTAWEQELPEERTVKLPSWPLKRRNKEKSV